jgi:hypothetical protein
VSLWDWIQEFARGITERIDTGLRELLQQPEEIRPEVITRPATPEQIEEALEEAVWSERFIREIELDEAIRLGRGVPFYEKLTNVARMRHWTTVDPFTWTPPPDAQISVRAVLIGPDGTMTYTDVSGRTGEPLSYDDFIRRAASSLDDDFVAQYEGVGRSDMVREWVVSTETYVQRFKPL